MSFPLQHSTPGPGIGCEGPDSFAGSTMRAKVAVAAVKQAALPIDAGDPISQGVRHAQAPDPDLDPVCILCGRPIPPGVKSSLHHLVPKLKGGTHRGTVRLHQVCHSAIHARYTEAEIARNLADPAALRTDPELVRFVAWVRTKPDDFHAPTRRARGRTAKWR